MGVPSAPPFVPGIHTRLANRTPDDFGGTSIPHAATGCRVLQHCPLAHYRRVPRCGGELNQAALRAARGIFRRRPRRAPNAIQARPRAEWPKVPAGRLRPVGMATEGKPLAFAYPSRARAAQAYAVHPPPSARNDRTAAPCGISAVTGEIVLQRPAIDDRRQAHRSAEWRPPHRIAAKGPALGSRTPPRFAIAACALPFGSAP